MWYRSPNEHICYHIANKQDLYLVKEYNLYTLGYIHCFYEEHSLRKINPKEELTQKEIDGLIRLNRETTSGWNYFVDILKKSRGNHYPKDWFTQCFKHDLSQLNTPPQVKYLYPLEPKHPFTNQRWPKLSSDNLRDKFKNRLRQQSFSNINLKKENATNETKENTSSKFPANVDGNETEKINGFVKSILENVIGPIENEMDPPKTQNELVLHFEIGPNGDIRPISSPFSTQSLLKKSTSFEQENTSSSNTFNYSYNKKEFKVKQDMGYTCATKTLEYLCDYGKIQFEKESEIIFNEPTHLSWDNSILKKREFIITMLDFEPTGSYLIIQNYIQDKMMVISDTPLTLDNPVDNVYIGTEPEIKKAIQEEQKCIIKDLNITGKQKLTRRHISFAMYRLLAYYFHKESNDSINEYDFGLDSIERDNAYVFQFGLDTKHKASKKETIWKINFTY